MAERYEVDIITPQQETRLTFSDLDTAAARFYMEIAMDYSEPSTEIGLHDLVQGKTLASWVYDPNADIGKVTYDVN